MNKILILSMMIAISLISFANAEGIGKVCIDLDAPSAPTNLALSISRNNNVQLSWDAAIDIPDCSGIDYYNIYRDNTKIGKTSLTNFTDHDLASGTYNYAISAVDLVGHEGLPISSVIEIIGPAPTGEGGGAGGAGAAAPSMTYFLGVLEEETITVKEDDKISFNLNGEHLIDIIEISDLGSSYVRATLIGMVSLGQTKNIDLDNDGTDDLSVFLVNIDKDKGEAILTLKRIEKSAGESESIGEEITRGEEGQAPITGAVIGTEGNMDMGIVVLMIAIALAIVLITILLRKKFH